MRNGVEIFSRLSVSDPKSFLGGGFELGVIPLTLCSQGIDRLKGNGIPLDGEPVIIRQCHIFCTACGFGTLVETFMTAWTVMQMRCTLVRTAVFLPGMSVIRKLSVPVHGKPGFADGRAAGNLVWILRVSLVEWDYTVAVVNIMNGVVDRFHIISLIRNKGAFLYRQVSTGFLQDIQSNGGICHIGSGS